MFTCEIWLQQQSEIRNYYCRQTINNNILFCYYYLVIPIRSLPAKKIVASSDGGQSASPVNSPNCLSIAFISDFNEVPVHQHFHPVASEVVEDGQMHGGVISSNCLSVNSLVVSRNVCPSKWSSSMVWYLNWPWAMAAAASPATINDPQRRA